MSAFPTQAEIVRAVKAAEKAGLDVGGFRIEPNGALLVLAQQAPGLASALPSGQDEPNDFD
jgi:hypothetical protein